MADGILDLDEHWDGGGQPLGLAGDAIPLYARIALLAQVVDVFHIANGREAAIAEVERRVGRLVRSRARRRLRARRRRDGLLGSAARRTTCSRRSSRSSRRTAARWSTRTISTTSPPPSRRSIDAKSPYTSGHSERVALFTDLIAEELGLDAERRRWLKRAALLHDIGKLGVCNAILDKPGKLDDDEWAAMQRTPRTAEAILSRIAAFSDLARIAGAHHERLDGKGYPRGISGEQIALETRIVTTADIFDALTADRPYRAAMPVSKAFGIMTDMIGTQIDPVCFGALRRAMRRLDEARAA